MKVTTTPAAHLAFTNLAHCSPSDLSQFAPPIKVNVNAFKINAPPLCRPDERDHGER
ncbi:hypothetical protein YC2023_016877 [Brassica napus]